MAFKDSCCGVCAWFSVVGVFTYFVLAMMLYRRNQPVIEHKFKIEFEDEETLNKTMVKMIIMVCIMAAASVGCFGAAATFRAQDQEK